MNLGSALARLLGGAGHAVAQGVQNVEHALAPQQQQNQAPIIDHWSPPAGMQQAIHQPLMPLMPKAQFKPMPYMGYNGQPLPMGSPNPSAFAVRPNVDPYQMPNQYQDETAGGSLQGYNQNDMSQGIQGGTVNQGYIPMQGSNYGSGGFASNLQPASPLQRLLK